MLVQQGTRAAVARGTEAQLGKILCELISGDWVLPQPHPYIGGKIPPAPSDGSVVFSHPAWVDGCVPVWDQDAQMYTCGKYITATVDGCSADLDLATLIVTLHRMDSKGGILVIQEGVWDVEKSDVVGFFEITPAWDKLRLSLANTILREVGTK
jgi:hypothetical protein